MTAVLQFPLSPLEFNQLKREFPLIEFVHYSHHGLPEIPKEIWKKTEILFGGRLSEENLQHASELHWIHTPNPSIDGLCLKEIEHKGNILISYTPERNIDQIGEYVQGCMLAFAKNLFQWKAADQFPPLLWDCKWRNNMWMLKNKVLLQIGLGDSGLAIAEKAKDIGMKVWGIDKLSSVRPGCDKNFEASALHDLLPLADVVSLTSPREAGGVGWKLGRDELNLMKHDSILIFLGTNRLFDEDALCELAMQDKFRGILFDAYYQTAIPSHSKLWKIPKLLLTPGVATRPKLPDHEAFPLFRINLRQYLHGNYAGMLHLIDPSLVEPSEYRI